ncbi:F-box only protein 42 [Hemicordylus capensis]|uniref:F-box only protein 42 n=1 Tax=Hemicordylus capensis TaxID=884348 RepID=UPI0023049654|nr:F-box only protein 42 [Hemicordylus capensis]
MRVAAAAFSLPACPPPASVFLLLLPRPGRRRQDGGGDGGRKGSGSARRRLGLLGAPAQAAARTVKKKRRRGRRRRRGPAAKWNAMAHSSDSEDDSFMAVDPEEAAAEGSMEQDEESRPREEEEQRRQQEEKQPQHHRSMLELPEEVLEYILSFLSPYQEHKTAALVCKQWYRLIKGVAHQCYHGFIKAVQEGNIQWESRTYPYPGTPITQRFSHSACYYGVNQSMYVFGGCTQSSCNAAFNDLWRLDLNSKEWIRPLASGSYPSPKAGATLVVYKDLLVLFGGWTRPSPYPLHQPERFFDEIHTYSPSKNWWNCVVTTHGPPPMAGHSSCVIQDKMIVFGGSLGSRQMSNDVWVLDLEQWAWSKPNISGPSPHPRGGQSQIVIDDETILVLGGCGGPNALFKDAWLLRMNSSPWTWQPLKVENEDQGAPELWCHPACKVGQCVVVFSQAPSGRAPLSPSLNSRPSPISATPPALVPETREYRSQSPVRTADEAPCVNGRWGTLRPRAQRQTPSGSREGSLSPAREDSSPVLNGSGGLSPGALAVGGASLDSPVQAVSPSMPSAAEGCDLKLGLPLAPRRGSLPDQKDLRLASVDLNWEPKLPALACQLDSSLDSSRGTVGGGGVRNPPEQTNGIHSPPQVASSLAGAVSPGALRRSLEAVKALSSKGPPALAVLSPPLGSSPGSPGSQSASSAAAAEPAPAPRPGSAQGDGHSLPPIARRLGHHPPQSLNVGKPLYQSMNCKPMQMYVLDIKDSKEHGRVQWKLFSSSAVVGPPETSLHTVVQGRGEVIIFGGLMDKKQNVKYYPKTNALYFVRAKR